MTSSSTGFIGLAAVRYFPSEITPLASINSDVSGGFDIIKKYTLSIGAGSTSSTFFYPYTNTTLGSTFITFGTICDVLNYLNLLMGQIQLQTNLLVSVQKGVSTYSITMNFQYTYEGVTSTVQAQFLNGQCTVSTKVLLPIPIILGEPCTSTEQGLASFNLPCCVVIDRNADSLKSLASSGSSATLIPLSGYLVTDLSLIPSSFSQSNYSLVISDVNSTLTKPFTFNRTVYSIVSEELGPLPSGVKSNIVILGGFTASLQYQGGNPPAGTTTIASSVNNTLGSIILQNV
jgi:hypothetical protein